MWTFFILKYHTKRDFYIYFLSQVTNNSFKNPYKHLWDSPVRSVLQTTQFPHLRGFTRSKQCRRIIRDGNCLYQYLNCKFIFKKEESGQSWLVEGWDKQKSPKTRPQTRSKNVCSEKGRKSNGKQVEDKEWTSTWEASQSLIYLT